MTCSKCKTHELTFPSERVRLIRTLPEREPFSLDSSPKIDQLLQEIPFFSQLNPEQLSALRQAGQIEAVPAKQVLFHEGDLAETMYIVLTGQVQVEGRAHDGAEVTLSHLGPGEFFGELALADGGIRTAAVATLENSEFFTITRSHFAEILTTSPQLLSDVIAAISQKVRSANTNFFQQLLEKQEMRLQMEREKHQIVAQMVTGVAHEINTPLGILNALNVDLLDTADDALKGIEPDFEQMQYALRLMQKNITRLRDLVHTFRNVSASQVGETPEWMDPEQVLKQALNLYRMASPEHLDVQLEFASELQGSLCYAYEGLLDDCIMHIMTNIERHAYPEAAGPVFWQVQIGEFEGQTALCLRIRDQGVGMSAEVLERACLPFFSTARHLGHKGLGLTIVQNLVQNIFWGRLDLQSTPAQGTEVCLCFPVKLKSKTERSA